MPRAAGPPRPAIRSPDEYRELAEKNLRLVPATLWRYFRRYMDGTQDEDLIAVGHIGLMEAARLYDPEYGTTFATFAVPSIANAVRKYLRSDNVVHIPHSVWGETPRVLDAERVMRLELGRDASASEIALRVGLDEYAVATIIQNRANSLVSLDAPIETHDGEISGLYEMLPGDHDEDALVDGIDVQAAVDCLPRKLRAVIRLRFLEDMTQVEAAAILRTSQAEMSRRERKGLEELRAILTGERKVRLMRAKTAERQEAVQMFEQHMTARQVSRTLGVAYTTALNWRRAYDADLQITAAKNSAAEADGGAPSDAPPVGWKREARTQLCTPREALEIVKACAAARATSLQGAVLADLVERYFEPIVLGEVAE